jgi:hypothetical protein
MSQFAILYNDDNQIKEYYLGCMNINLLRLNSNSNFSLEIKDFIKKIIRKDNYIIKNSINKFDNIKRDHLIKFHQDYNYNHNALLDRYIPEDNGIDCIHNYSNKPMDKYIIVPRKDFIEIIKRLD